MFYFLMGNYFSEQYAHQSMMCWGGGGESHPLHFMVSGSLKISSKNGCLKTVLFLQNVFLNRVIVFVQCVTKLACARAVHA